MPLALQSAAPLQRQAQSLSLSVCPYEQQSLCSLTQKGAITIVQAKAHMARRFFSLHFWHATGTLFFLAASHIASILLSPLSSREFPAKASASVSGLDSESLCDGNQSGGLTAQSSLTLPTRLCLRIAFDHMSHDGGASSASSAILMQDGGGPLRSFSVSSVSRFVSVLRALMTC